MTMSSTDPTFRERILILIIGLVLVTMLLASVWQRLSHSSLTIHHNLPAPEVGRVASDDQVGILMRKVAENPQDKEATLQLAQELLEIGQWDGAINFAQKALSISTPEEKDFRPLYLLGLAHHYKGEHAQAAELLEKSVEVQPTPAAYYGLGLLYLHFLNNPELARKKLEAGLEIVDLPPAMRLTLEEELQKASLPQDK